MIASPGMSPQPSVLRLQSSNTEVQQRNLLLANFLSSAAPTSDPFVQLLLKPDSITMSTLLPFLPFLQKSSLYHALQTSNPDLFCIRFLLQVLKRVQTVLLPPFEHTSLDSGEAIWVYNGEIEMHEAAPRSPDCVSPSPSPAKRVIMPFGRLSVFRAPTVPDKLGKQIPTPFGLAAKAVQEAVPGSGGGPGSRVAMLRRCNTFQKPIDAIFGGVANLVTANKIIRSSGEMIWPENIDHRREPRFRNTREIMSRTAAALIKLNRGHIMEARGRHLMLN